MLSCVRFGFIAALTFPAAAGAQLLDQTAYIERCATRDTATAWLRMVNEWRRERPGGWSNDSLRSVVIALARADSLARPSGIDSLQRDVAARLQRHENTMAATMRNIMRRFGWPSRSMVGVAGVLAAMRVVSTNTAIQDEALRAMRSLPPDEVPLFEVAALEDRIRMSRSETQLYATQLKPGTGEFYPVDSLSRLGERRAQAGLPPMPVYLCIIRASIGVDATWPPPEYKVATATQRIRKYWRPHARVHAGAPQVASVALGGMYVMWRAPDASRWNGMLFIVEPGVRAGKLRIGYGSSTPSAFGVSGTIGYLNYWGNGSWHVPTDKYAGLEVHVSARYVDVGLGQYQSLQHGKLRFAASLGFGL